MIHLNFKLENLLHMHYPSCPTSAGDTRRRQINKSFPLNQVDRCLWLHRMDVRGVRRATDSKGGSGQYIQLELNHHARLVVGLYWSTSSIKSIVGSSIFTVQVHFLHIHHRIRNIVGQLYSWWRWTIQQILLQYLPCSTVNAYAPTKLFELEISCRS